MEHKFCLVLNHEELVDLLKNKMYRVNIDIYFLNSYHLYDEFELEFDDIKSDFYKLLEGIDNKDCDIDNSFICNTYSSLHLFHNLIREKIKKYQQDFLDNL